MNLPTTPIASNMNHPTRLTFACCASLMVLSLIASAVGATPKLLDDYSHSTRNQNGVDRLLFNDTTAGSQSRATVTCTNGVLRVKGELVPGRGVPAFISQVSLLSPDGKPQDLTAYQGVRLRVKVLRGLLCVQVGSAAVTNFDYHTEPPIAGKGGEFHEVKVPFKQLKRSWSEQTPLQLKSITSINLVSFGMVKDSSAPGPTPASVTSRIRPTGCT